MPNKSSFNRLIQAVKQSGVAVEKETRGFAVLDVDIVFPHIILILCIRGNATALYDMQEMTFGVNDLAFIMPGHILHPLSCSPDFTYVRIAVSSDMVMDLQSRVFSHEYDKFNYAPVCHLTDVQVRRMQAFTELLDAVASHDTEDLKLRRLMLLYLLTVEYEFLNYYRREQDRRLGISGKSALFARFCNLVVRHHTESHKVKFYAGKVNLHPYYFSLAIREVAGMSPAEWIRQYLIAQAKQMIETRPEQSLKETAFLLGFSEPSAFYRFFKHATGITASTYREYVRR